MILFDFPDGHVLNKYAGITALPQGLWVVGLNKYGCALLVWPDGRTALFNGLIYRNYGNDTVNVWKITDDQLHGLEATNNNLHFNGRPVLWSECRTRSYIGDQMSGSDPDGDDGSVVVRAMDRGMDKDYDTIMRETIGLAMGVAVYRRGEGVKFINPDPENRWLIACLSADRLTCLAVHESGGCVLDIEG